MVQVTGVVLVGIIVGSLVCLVVRYFLFRVGCILADLPDTTVGRSLAAFLIVVGVTIPLIVFAGYQLSSLEKRLANQAGMIFYPGLVLSLIVCWLLAAAVYGGVLWTSFTRGLIVAGVELLLTALVAGLVTALILVIGAAWQVWPRGNPRNELTPPPPAMTLVIGRGDCS
jgi:hypothetical protein